MKNEFEYLDVLIPKTIKSNYIYIYSIFKILIDPKLNYFNSRRILKRISTKDETILSEIKRIVEVKDTLPNSIIKYHKFFVNDQLERFYFVTDPYESTNIERMLKKVENKGQQISSSKIIDFSLHILDALAFIHLRGIIHRDLKPK